MSNRTVQLLGQGYGANPAEITVTSNGNTIFSGTVNTVNQLPPLLPNFDLDLTNVLCTFEIDLAFTGQIPMTCAVSSGSVIFAQIYANYVNIPNPVFTQEQRDIVQSPNTTQAERVAIWIQVANPPLSQQDIEILLDPTSTKEQKSAILAAHSLSDCSYMPSGPDGYGPIDDTDPRSSVTIDGIAQLPVHGEFAGTWWWTINTGSTLAYQLEVDPAVV
jgi:hypothetical protein